MIGAGNRGQTLRSLAGEDRLADAMASTEGSVKLEAGRQSSSFGSAETQKTYDTARKEAGGGTPDKVLVQKTSANPAFGAAVEAWATLGMNAVNDYNALFSTELSAEEKKAAAAAVGQLPEKLKAAFPGVTACVDRYVKLFSIQYKDKEIENVLNSTLSDIANRIEVTASMLGGGLSDEKNIPVQYGDLKTVVSEKQVAKLHLAALRQAALRLLGYYPQYSATEQQSVWGTIADKEDTVQNNSIFITHPSGLPPMLTQDKPPKTGNPYPALSGNPWPAILLDADFVAPGKVPGVNPSPLLPLEVAFPGKKGIEKTWTSVFSTPEEKAAYKTRANPLDWYTPAKLWLPPLNGPFSVFYGPLTQYTMSGFEKSLYTEAGAGYILHSLKKLGSFNLSWSAKPSLDASVGATIPQSLPELGAPFFNMGTALLPGAKYVAKFAGQSKAVQAALGKASPSWKATKIPASGPAGKELTSVQYLDRAAASETLLLELVNKMLVLEMLLGGYTKKQQAEDELFFTEALGKAFKLQHLVAVASSGAKGAKAANTLVALTGSAGGKLQQAVTASGLAKALLEKLKEDTTKVWTEQGELVSFAKCSALPTEVQLYAQAVAQVNAAALSANAEAKIALGMADTLAALAAKIAKLTEEFEKLTAEKLKLDKELNECESTTSGKQKMGVFDVGSEPDKCAKIKAARTNLLQKRASLAEDIVDLARSQGRRQGLRQARNNTSKGTSADATETESRTIKVTLTGTDGKKEEIGGEIGLSPQAVQWLAEAQEASAKAQEKADSAASQTSQNLNAVGTAMGQTGLGALVTTDNKIYEVVLPKFIDPYVQPEEEDKGSSLWWLLAGAAALYAKFGK